ncbi:toprim domain-containing protein [[Brevibacterium] frigoritolerans]|nr:toprim domain-containing protein [Peribacillus frigoritolerans]
MNATEFHQAVKDSGITTAAVLHKIFTDEKFKLEENRNKYPDSFDANGKTTMTFNTNQRIYHTYCPFHTKQDNGDSFAVYNKDQNAYCYSKGCTPRPMNLVELVISLMFDNKPAIATNSDLSGKFFWPAAKFLVQHFGDELGIKLSELKSEGGFKRDVTQEILQATVEYYHFLGTKTNYAKKLDDYYENTRHFKFAEVPFETIKKENVLGITPRSEERNKLFQYLVKKKFKESEILESKVCFKTEDGKIMDSFNNHAIVPYFHNKRVFGFYGKNLNPKAKIPHKRLAGIYDTPSGLDDISDEEEFYLVEGENSKTALKAMGFKNVMETRGANGFKDIHAEKIKKYRELTPDKMKKVYLVLDPDAPGQEKVMTIGKQLLEIAGVEPLAIPMPILEKNGKTWYLDTNDLFEAYQSKAKEEFLALKSKAKSLDAFSIVYMLQQENISTLSEARVALKRHSVYLESVPKLERMFIMEEVIEQLYPAFESIGLSKDLLRDYLKELWLGQEAKKPLEGFDENTKRHPYWIVTQNEDTFKKFKPKAPHLLLVREVSYLQEKIEGKNILLDSSFNDIQIAQFKKYTKKVFVGDLSEEPSGNIVLEDLKKV